VALDGEDGTTAQRDQDTTPGTAAVELADGYKPWEDAALDNEPLLHGVFGTNKISLGWLEDHEIPYVPTLQYFRGLIGMHQSGHPSIPPQRPVFTRPQISFDHSLQSSYDKEVAGFCADFANDLPRNALELSKLLYDLSPCCDTLRSGKILSTKTLLPLNTTHLTLESEAQFKHMITSYEMSLAVLARFILNASDSFVCVLPVIVTDIGRFAKKFILQPWALYIRLRDGTETILPVALRLVGSTPGITKLVQLTSLWSQETDVQDMFNPYPILSVSDVEYFEETSLARLISWPPRRYRATIAYSKQLQRARHSIATTRDVPRADKTVKY
jgi:hypothetical protein